MQRLPTSARGPGPAPRPPPRGRPRRSATVPERRARRCSSSTAATVSTIPRNGSRAGAGTPSTHSSLAALKTAGAVPPDGAGLAGQPRPPGTPRRRAARTPRSRPWSSRRPAPRPAPGRASPAPSAIGSRMSGGLACASVEPSTNSTIEWTTDCGCTTTSMRSNGHVEEQVRLDHLQALVDQGRGVDGDDRAHVPGRVGERLLGRDVGELGAAAAAERPAADAVSTSRRTSSARPAAQALGERRVLGVDRDDLAGPRHAALTSGPPTMSDSLLASARVRPASSAASVGREPDRAGDAVEHDVAGPGGELGRGVRAGQDLGQRLAGARSRAVRRGVERELQVLGGARPRPRRRPRRRSSRACSASSADPAAAGGQPDDPEPVGVARDDVDRLGADRPGEPRITTSRGVAGMP